MALGLQNNSKVFFLCSDDGNPASCCNWCVLHRLLESTFSFHSLKMTFNVKPTSSLELLYSSSTYWKGIFQHCTGEMFKFSLKKEAKNALTLSWAWVGHPSHCSCDRFLGNIFKKQLAINIAKINFATISLVSWLVPHWAWFYAEKYFLWPLIRQHYDPLTSSLGRKWFSPIRSFVRRRVHFKHVYRSSSDNSRNRWTTKIFLIQCQEVHLKIRKIYLLG